MEKKQLNFSAPLLSARRYSSPLRPSGEEDKRKESPPRKAIPSEQSDLNLGEVVKPGSIPFMWEQIPGKAKSSTESRVQSPEEFPSTPKLPPAFLGRKSGELSGFRTPNKLSGELGVLKPPRNKLSGELNHLLRPQNKVSGELHTLRPHKFSGELNAFRSCQNKLSGELGILSKYPSLNDTTTTTDMNPSSESEDDGVGTFSDALDTFSQLDSSSLNCSITGLSGFQHPEPKHVANPSMEPRARDFMMDRFLPAAKAMTLEPSQYASRKQLAAVEQQKEVKAMVPRARTPPPSRNVCNIVPYTGQDIGSEQSEDDDDEDDEGYDERSAISVKVKACGFLPWFCSKNSIRLFNPLPSMKNGSKSVLSSASKVGNLVKNRSWRSPSPKLAKHVPCSNHKHKVAPAFKSCELQKPKLISRPMFYSGELQTTRSGSPYRNANRRNSPSVYRNESPHTLYHKGVGVLTVPKRVNPYDENRMNSGPKESKRFEQQLRKNTTTTLEETMYIDSVNIAKVSHSILNLPKTKKQVDGSSNELGGLSKSGRLDIMRARGMSGPLSQRSNFSEAPKMGANGNRNTCRELVVVGDDQPGARSSFTPPLPKSPSESWLSRNLPSVSPRNSVSYSSLNSKVKSRKQNANGAPASGAKWETIVKSSHLHHDHGRYSEELVTHAPQRPQTRK